MADRTHFEIGSSHLIIYGSLPRYSWAPDYPYGLRKEEIEVEIATFVKNFGEPFPLESGAPSMAGNAAAADWFAAYIRFSASPRVAEKITRMNYEHDYRDVLPAIRVPTFVLHREGDRWCEIMHAQYLAQHIAGAELRVIPGEDHLPWYGDQDKLVAEIEEFVTGESVAVSIDRTLLTVVFMDIVESTDRLAEMGDERWRAVLEQWDVAECAQAVRRDAERLGLACRTGVHTGECERRGEDLSGMSVHIAARIMSDAKAGMIACSRTVRDLAVGSELDFAPLGKRSLKGVPGEWALFTVRS